MRASVPLLDKSGPFSFLVCPPSVLIEVPRASANQANGCCADLSDFTFNLAAGAVVKNRGWGWGSLLQGSEKRSNETERKAHVEYSPIQILFLYFSFARSTRRRSSQGFLYDDLDISFRSTGCIEETADRSELRRRNLARA